MYVVPVACRFTLFIFGAPARRSARLDIPVDTQSLAVASSSHVGSGRVAPFPVCLEFYGNLRHFQERAVVARSRSA